MYLVDLLFYVFYCIFLNQIARYALQWLAPFTFHHNSFVTMFEIQFSSVYHVCLCLCVGMYTPGMMTDVVREVKEAARVREDALLSRVRAMVEERSWTMNETQMKLVRNVEEMKVCVRVQQCLNQPCYAYIEQFIQFGFHFTIFPDPNKSTQSRKIRHKRSNHKTRRGSKIVASTIDASIKL